MHENKKRERLNRVIYIVKIGAFFLALFSMGLVGLMWFLRPEVSQVEKRALTKFPQITLAGIWDGSFFAGVDTWYADTFPMRERLIAANQTLQSLYGIRGDQLVGGAVQADAVPVFEDEQPQDAAPTATPMPSPTPDGKIHTIGEMEGSVYITNNCAYGLYGFSQAGADAYISTMNQIYEQIGDKVEMYVMDVPLSASVMLDQSVIDDMGSTNEGEAMAYIYARLNPGIHGVNIYDNLVAHNREYIYFRTDHHWTQLGAFYAYETFCREKGIRPNLLEVFRTTAFGTDAYLGSYYSSSNQSPQLAANPDTVYAWYPLCTDDKSTDMYMVEQDGNGYDWRIINDMFDYPDSEWYCVFSGADQPFCSFHNESITDGSAIMVVKDSYGNALIPWLVDHYEYVYWVDFRYTDETVSHMVEEYGVQDVLFQAAMFNATGNLCNELFLRIGQ